MRRLTGGVVLIALLSFVAQALVLWLWLRPVAAEVAVHVAEQALQVRVALAAVSAADRPGLAQRLSTPVMSLSRSEPTEADGPMQGPPADFDVMIQALAEEGVDVRLEERAQVQGQPGAAVVFRLPVAGEIWWMTHAVQRPPSALSSTLAVWLMVLAVATVGALLVSVRLIARPIGRLAEQIGAQQGNLRPLPQDGDASTELQALVHAFNELAHQVTANAQARQQLLAGVSHDLRTPLARLRLRAETQCEPQLADALTADLMALERIVNQFLAYVQGDSGAALGLESPLEDSVRDTVQRYAAAGQALHVEIEPVTQQAPDVAVQRLLANLIDNACAYGRAPVHVALRTTQDGTELCVSDEGPGMSDDEFERAQQPFVRLTRTRSELGHCGLGLAIVAQIARQLGGRLQPVRSEGGRFGISLVLPRAPA